MYLIVHWVLSGLPVYYTVKVGRLPTEGMSYYLNSTTVLHAGGWVCKESNGNPPSPIKKRWSLASERDLEDILG